MNSKDQETKTVPAPRLRFPGFDAEWEEKPLKDIASVIRRRAGSDVHTPMSITSGVGLISQAEKFGREIAGEQYKNYIVIEKNDFAYNKSATKEFPEGFLTMYTLEQTGAVPSSIFTCFRADDGQAVPQYLNYLFQDNLHGKWLRKFISVGARANGALAVETSDLMNTPVPLPMGATSLQEQTRIAAALSSLDAVIAAHHSKQDGLREHKRGLMAGLFPAEGKRVPRLRFPEFEGAGEWEEKKLGELLLTRPDYGLNAPAVPFSEELPTYLRITDISEEGKYINSGRVSVRAQVSEENYLQVGEIVLARTGASVGKSYLYRSGDDRLVFAGFLIRLKPNPEILDSSFLSNFLNTLRYWKWVAANSARSGQPGINSSEYSGLPIPLPSLPEQQRIAACLSSLDDLIAVQGDKITALQEFKQGLMHGLFPVGDRQ